MSKSRISGNPQPLSGPRPSNQVWYCFKMDLKRIPTVKLLDPLKYQTSTCVDILFKFGVY